MQTVNNLPAMQETRIQYQDQEGLMEKEMATNSRKYSCLENSMDRGTWQGIVHGITESDMTERLTLTFMFLREVLVIILEFRNILSSAIAK